MNKQMTLGEFVQRVARLRSMQEIAEYAKKNGDLPDEKEVSEMQKRYEAVVVHELSNIYAPGIDKRPVQ